MIFIFWLKKAGDSDKGLQLLRGTKPRSDVVRMGRLTISGDKLQLNGDYWANLNVSQIVSGIVDLEGSADLTSFN